MAVSLLITRKKIERTTLYFLFFFRIHVHSNLSDRHIKSMEFNVLDSLNTKLIRPVSYFSEVPLVCNHTFLALLNIKFLKVNLAL